MSHNKQRPPTASPGSKQVSGFPRQAAQPQFPVSRSVGLCTVLCKIPGFASNVQPLPRMGIAVTSSDMKTSRGLGECGGGTRPGCWARGPLRKFAPSPRPHPDHDCCVHHEQSGGILRRAGLYRGHCCGQFVKRWSPACSYELSAAGWSTGTHRPMF